MPGERWPPAPKPIEECAHYHTLEPFLGPFDFEIDPSLYPFDDVLPLHMCKKFLKQVRESRGYDVNILAPASPFCPTWDGYLEEKGGIFDTHVVPECKSVVDQINEEAKWHGKFYVFDKIQKEVEVHGYRCSLITFTVREASSNKLETVRACGMPIRYVEWSFKGEGEEEVSYDYKDVYWMPKAWSSGRWIRV